MLSEDEGDDLDGFAQATSLQALDLNSSETGLANLQLGACKDLGELKDLKSKKLSKSNHVAGARVFGRRLQIFEEITD